MSGTDVDAIWLTADGQRSAYLARPTAGARGPGVLVIHEGYGLNAHAQVAAIRAPLLLFFVGNDPTVPEAEDAWHRTVAFLARHRAGAS